MMDLWQRDSNEYEPAMDIKVLFEECSLNKLLGTPGPGVRGRFIKIPPCAVPGYGWRKGLPGCNKLTTSRKWAQSERHQQCIMLNLNKFILLIRGAYEDILRQYDGSHRLAH
jgi:hypothetical protein